MFEFSSSIRTGWSEVCVSARISSLLPKLLLPVTGQEDGRRRTGFEDVSCRLDTVAVRHSDVEDSDIGFCLTYDCVRFRAVLCDPDHLMAQLLNLFNERRV